MRDKVRTDDEALTPVSRYAKDRAEEGLAHVVGWIWWTGVTTFWQAGRGMDTEVQRVRDWKGRLMGALRRLEGMWTGLKMVKAVYRAREARRALRGVDIRDVW